MNTASRKRVLVLFGGESAEHDVSIKSAINIVSAIDTTTYKVLLGYIDGNGAWWMVEAIQPNMAEITKKSWTPLMGTSSLLVVDSNKPIAIDVVFPVLHGPNGEDGTVQGLAQLLHVPVVGCGITGSVLCIDKSLTKQIARGANVPVVQSVELVVGQNMDYQRLLASLGDTLFIKPADQGSSVGVSKATNSHQFDEAILEARKYSSKILIEQAIVGREIELAVLEINGEIQVSVAGEIVPDREFYSYESKYDEASTSQCIIPAILDNSVLSQLQAYAKTMFRALNCHGLARIDFFLTEDNTIYLNEVNTMPGFTNISMYPKLWEASGLLYTALVVALIENAQ